MTPTPVQIKNPLIPTKTPGSVDLSSPTALFQIDLSAYKTSSARIILGDLTGDANLKVYNANRSIAKESINGGRFAEAVLLKDLPAGIYTIEVTLDSSAVSANYNLNVAVNADASLNNLWWRSSPDAQAGSWNMNGVDRVSGEGGFYTGVPAEWQVQGVADFNGDGEDDLMWRNMTTGEVGAWLFKNGERFATSNRVEGVPLEWQIVSTADMDGDTRADLLWRNTQTGEVGVWITNGDRFITGLTAAGISLNWVPIKTADLDGDGKSDIVWRDMNEGTIAIWLMDGINYRTNQRGTIGVPLDWQPQFYADFNGDGQDDMLWRSQSGQVGVWLMNGIQRLQAWSQPGSVPLEWQIEGLGDFDGNATGGSKDVLWRNTRTGELAVWFMAADGSKFTSTSFIKPSQGLDWSVRGADWSSAAIGDFNNDGKADIVYRSEKQQGVEILLMNGATVTNKRFYEGIGGSWRVQGVMKRTLTPAPFNISGRTPTGTYDSNTAFNIGALQGKGAYQDQVRLKEDDFYRFNLAVRSLVTIGVDSGIKWDLFQVAQTGALTAITMPVDKKLAVGNYVIKVSTQLGANTPYALSLEGLPDIVDPASAGFVLSTSDLALKASTRKEVDGNGNEQEIPITDDALLRNVIQATFKVKNNGATAINQLKIGFRISRDSTIDRVGSSTTDNDLYQVDRDSNGDLVRKIITLTQPLQPGEVREIKNVDLRLPDVTDPFWVVDGKYYLGMVVNPDVELLESAEYQKNNFNVAFGIDKAEIQVTKTESVDLVVSAMSLPSTSVTPGSEVMLSYSITNRGNKAVSNNTSVKIAFYLSPDADINQSIDNRLKLEFIDPVPNKSVILGNSTIKGTVKLTLPPADWSGWGTERKDFYLAGWVNPDASDLGEADYDNNRLDATDATTVAEAENKNYLKIKQA